MNAKINGTETSVNNKRQIAEIFFVFNLEKYTMHSC